MITRWQITTSEDKKKILFLDGTKQDLTFVYKKFSSLIENAKYAKKPYDYCLFLKEETDTAAVENIKTAMSALVQISKKELPKTEKGENDFFDKLEKGLLEIDRKKSNTYHGQDKLKNPQYLSKEIKPTQNWQVVDGTEKKKLKEESSDFFDKLEGQLTNLGKSKQKKETKKSKEEKPRSAQKAKLDFSFLNKLFGKKETKAPAETKTKAEEKTIDKTIKKETPKNITTPAHFKFKRSAETELSLNAPVNPDNNVDTLIVAPQNRAAHAGIISALDNPDEYNNPLLIYGPPQSGKSHFLNACYLELSNKFNKKTLFTTGLRLYGIIKKSIENKTLSNLDKELREYDAVLIDDINNMLVDSSSRAFLLSLFDQLKKNKKQIIYTSRFTSKNLEHIFSQVNFKLPIQSNIELKVLKSSEAAEILKKYVTPLELSEEQEAKLLKTSLVNIKRISVLKKIMPSFPETAEEMLKLLSDKDENIAGLDQKKMGKVSLFKLPEENNWGKWGLFHPKGLEISAKYALYNVLDTAKNLKIQGGWQHIFTQPYDNTNLSFFAAQMVNYALDEKVSSLIVIGPGKEDKFFSKTSLFFSMLKNACKNVGLNCGCISYEELSFPGAYARLIADLLE